MRLGVFVCVVLLTSVAFADDGGGIDVGFDETKTLVWADAAHASWNVYTGDLQSLRDTGIYTQAPAPLVERTCDAGTPRLSFDDLPEPGRCAFLLVSGNGVVEGGLGTDSSGGIRPNTQSCHPDLTLPEPAGTPTAVAGHCRGLVVSWPASPSADVTIYRLRAGTEPGTPTYVWPVSGTVTYIDGLSDATTYYLSVVAVDAAGNESAPTQEITATTANTTTPQAPKELNVTDGRDAVFNGLTWSPVEINVESVAGDPASPTIRDLAGYWVYRSTGGDLPFDPAHRLGDLVESGTFEGDLVRACSHHFYAVTAVDTCAVESAPSPKAEVVAVSGPAPSPPAMVEVTRVGTTNVVNWTASTFDVEGQPIAPPIYVVERAGPATTLPDDLAFQRIADQDGSLQAIDESPPVTQPDEKLYYRVKAEDECPNVSAPSSTFEAACPFPGTIDVSPPDNAVVAGLVPVVVTASDSADLSSVTFTYTHEVVGVTRTFTRSGSPYNWVDIGWLASPVGNYLVTVTATAANGCIARKSVRLHAGSQVGCCLSLFPTTNTIATCASGPTKCKQVSYRIGNNQCLTAVALSSMNISWTDYTNTMPAWQTARFNGTNIAAAGSWTTSYGEMPDPTGTASKVFTGMTPVIPYASPMTSANTTVVTYVFSSFLDSGAGSTRKVDVFRTNQFVFRLLDDTGTPSEITTTCSFPPLTVN